MNLFSSLDLAWQMARGILFSPRAYMIFFVTARCNARCDFCFYYQEIESASTRKQLSLDEIEKFTLKLNHLLYLSIGGGEPTLRKDLPDIVSLFYRNCKTRLLNLVTNGYLSNQIAEQVERMLVENPHLKLKISISIDELEEKHDDIRRSKNAFKNALETIQKLMEVRNRQRYFGINIGTTFSKYNEDRVKEIIDYFDDYDINDHSMTFVRGDIKNEEHLTQSVEKYKEAVDYLDAKYQPDAFIFRIFHNLLRVMFKINIDTMEQKKMIIPCVAGGKMLTLSDEGDLKPCEMLEQIHNSDKYNTGNLRDYNYDIEAMCQTPKAKEVRKWIKDSKCHCTFECANMANIVFSKKSWLKVTKEYLKNI